MLYLIMGPKTADVVFFSPSEARNVGWIPPDFAKKSEKIRESLDSSDWSSDTLIGEQKANLIRRLGSSALFVP
jgi:hypothetical protein